MEVNVLQAKAEYSMFLTHDSKMRDYGKLCVMCV